MFAAVQKSLSFLSAHGGMARLNEPRASVCKFHAHMIHAVIQVSAYGIRTRDVKIKNPVRYQ